MATREKLLEKVEREHSAGRPWRAREILRDAMPAFATDTVLLERYGQLLDALGEKLEAGKYYFLSGVRRPEYQEAIRLFLHRHSRGGIHHLLAQFPGSVRKAGLGANPPVVTEELRSLGFPEASVRKRTFEPIYPTRPSDRVGNAIGVTLMVAVLFFLLASLTVGSVAILRWVLSLFS